MWEVFKFGHGSPYRYLRNDPDWKYGSNILLSKHLENGHRLAMPELCPDLVFDLMTQCWHLEPHQRPTFKELEILWERLSHENLQLGRPRCQSQTSEELSERSRRNTEISYLSMVSSPNNLKAQVSDNFQF